MKIEFAASQPQAGPEGQIALGLFEGSRGLSAAPGLGEALEAAVSTPGAFKGALGESRLLTVVSGAEVREVLLVGAGPAGDWTPRLAEQWAAHALNASRAPGGTLTLYPPDDMPATAAHAAFGVRLAAYRFDKYRTRPKGEARALPAAVVIQANDRAATGAIFDRLAGLADAICFARDLVSEPANVLYPAEFARRLGELSSLGVEVEVLGEAEMTRLGMGALLAVGQGSSRESQLAVLQWRGASDPEAAPIAFVGKGVCFDTGGISIKSADRMEEMIIDMAGAAAVAGALQALAARKARVNAVGVVGLVENMPDGAAQRPGDIVTTLSGQTVEIINTDAEGRLVLADALWYCQTRFKPRAIVDLATLTGVIMSALGAHIGGLFSNDDALAGALLSASASTGERLWRLPMPKDYESALESRAADMKHVGDRFGGAITAAQFLQRFVQDAPWAHLDVGLTVWQAKSRDPTAPDGATGFGVRLLDQLVEDAYEDGSA